MKLPWLRVIPAGLAAAAILAASAACRQSPASPGAWASASPVPAHRARAESGTAVGDTATTAVSASGDPAAATLLATADSTIPRFAVPGGPRTGWVPGTWHSARSTLPVIATRPGWAEVRLAQRPNQSTAWVRASDVTLTTTPYAIVIDLATVRLTLYRGGQRLFSASVGVGAVNDPTPTGWFFVAFLAAPPAPGYGAFVMVTSAHSNAITNWESSGDALVAIHGPLGADAQIGSTGARISHGCIRLHGSDLLRLRDVPAGTPVMIRP